MSIMNMSYIFKTQCPGCGNGDILWKHEGCEATATINFLEYVRCEKCSQRFKLKDLSFNCSTHTFRRKGNLF